MAPQPINEGDNRGLEQELRETIAILRGSTNNALVINSKLDEVARKQDNIPAMLADLERRQQSALDVLKRDFERMFVPRAEYDPKHQFIVDKLREYDRIIAESRTSALSYVGMQKDVADLKDDMKGVQAKGAATWTRVMSIIAVVGTIAGILFQALQHIRFFP